MLDIMAAPLGPGDCMQPYALSSFRYIQPNSYVYCTSCLLLSAHFCLLLSSLQSVWLPIAFECHLGIIPMHCAMHAHPTRGRISQANKADHYEEEFYMVLLHDENFTSCLHRDHRVIAKFLHECFAHRSMLLEGV